LEIRANLPQETLNQGGTADSMILRPAISCVFLGNFASGDELPFYLNLADSVTQNQLFPPCAASPNCGICDAGEFISKYLLKRHPIWY